MTQVALNPLAYVKLPETERHLTSLDVAFVEQRLCLISGPIGSGRHSLYRYWLTERWQGRTPPKEAVRPEQVLFVKLQAAERASMSPQRMLLGSVRHALDRRLRPAYVVDRGMGREEPSLSTRADLGKVLRAIRQDLANLKVKLLVLDNGHSLQEQGLDMALELFLDYDDVQGAHLRLRMLLVIAKAGYGDKNRVWNDIYNNGDARISSVYPAIELKRLNEKTLPVVLTLLLRNNLGADVDRSGSDVVRKKQVREFLAEVLRRTRGDWHNMPTVFKSLDLRLGEVKGNTKRLLTKKVMDAVITDLKRLSDQGFLPKPQKAQDASESDQSGEGNTQDEA